MATNATFPAIIKSDPAIVDTVAMVAAKIAHYNFEWRYVTMVMVHSLDILGVATFLKHFNKSIVMKLGRVIPENRVHVRQYVLFAEYTSDVIGSLEWMVESQYDNTGLFIVVCISNRADECEERAVMKASLKLSMINIIFLKPYIRTGEIGAFTFYPVRDNNLCYNSDPVRLDVTLDCPGGECYNVFSEKLTNLNHCTLTVSTFEQHPFMYLHDLKKPPTGGDGEILQVLIQKLNATLKIVIPTTGNWGHQENDSWTGSTGDVFHNRAFMSICSAPLTYNKHLHFQTSFTYTFMEIIWVAAMPSESPSYEKLYHPLKIIIRCLILSMFIIIVILKYSVNCKYFSSLRRFLRVDVSHDSIVLNAWMIFLGLPVLRMPRNTTLLSIVYFFVWFSFIMRTLYQAGLINALTRKQYRAELESFNEVLKAKRPFGGLYSLKEYYKEEPEIYDNWIGLSLDEVYMKLDKMAAGETDFVIGINKLTALEYIFYYNGTRMLQFIPDIIIKSPTVMYFKKFSPLAQPVNKILVSWVEGGGADFMYSYFYKQGKIFMARFKDKPVSLGLRHLGAVSVLMYIGWALSVFLFLIEVILGRMSLYKRNELKMSC